MSLIPFVVSEATAKVDEGEVSPPLLPHFGREGEKLGRVAVTRPP